MQVKLVGVQHVNFINNNGENIDGTNIFCAFKDENVEGLRTEKFFLRPEIKLPECKLNDALDISFNMKGINVNLKMYSFDHLRMYNIDHINTCCSRW